MSRHLLKEYTASFPTDNLYDIAKRDGRWGRLFVYTTPEEAERGDARLGARIRGFREGEQMKPIEISVIPYPEGDYWMITDGFHRIVSAKLLGIVKLEAHIKKFGKEKDTVLTELRGLLR